MTATATAHARPDCPPARARSEARAALRPVRLVMVETAPVRTAAPDRVPAAVYRRRRVVALLALVGLLVVAWVGLRALGTGPLSGPGRSGQAASGQGPSSPVSAGGSVVYVVQPGDTLWDLARRIRPEGDLRPVVDRLTTARGGTTLQVGERIVLPA